MRVEPEIGGVGEHGRHQGARVVRRRAGAQMREAIGEARPAVNFGEKFGDAQTRQHGVEPANDHVGRFVLDLANGADRQAFLGERGLGQFSGSGEGVDLAKARFQTLGFLVAPVLETIGERRGPIRRPFGAFSKASRGNRKSSKARNARLPSTQTSPDCSRSRSAIMTATS